MIHTKENYKTEIAKAYPELNQFFIDALVDLYFSEGGKDKVEKIVKTDKKRKGNSIKELESTIIPSVITREAEVHSETSTVTVSEN